MAICKFCDIPYTPKKAAQTFCSTRCNHKSKKILDAYCSGRLSALDFPKGQILKVMKNYNIPAHGILFDDRGARPGSYSGKVFDV